MNILAEEQLKILEKGLTEAEFEKRNEKFLELYYKLKNEDDKKWYSNLTLEQKKKLFKYILIGYKVKNRMGGFSCNLLKDEREATNRPIIYAITHVGKYDIEVISEAINNQYSLLSGDYEHIQGTFDDKILRMIGVIYFNERKKEDRQLAIENMKLELLKGNNIMYFPEGTWNLVSNLPIIPLYWGIVGIAQETNAIVIPIAAEQYGKTFKVKVGKNIDFNKYAQTTESKLQAISDLSDILSTLKWEIWESEALVKRDSLNGDEWDKYVADRLAEWPYFNLEYINGLTYRPKDVITKEEANGYSKTLIPNKNNAFIYNKRLSDDIFNI